MWARKREQLGDVCITVIQPLFLTSPSSLPASPRLLLPMGDRNVGCYHLDSCFHGKKQREKASEWNQKADCWGGAGGVDVVRLQSCSSSHRVCAVAL